MALFRAGKIWFLVATNLLARGLDFAGVNLGVLGIHVDVMCVAK